MEDEQKQINTEQEEAYIPRPAWQRWLARIALVVFIAFLIMYYTNIFRGGM